jgi:hypothetical protein
MTTKKQKQAKQMQMQKAKANAKGEREECAVNARLFAFRIAAGCLRPLHFLSGQFAKNTYENSRVSG